MCLALDNGWIRQGAGLDVSVSSRFQESEMLLWSRWPFNLKWFVIIETKQKYPTLCKCCFVIDCLLSRRYYPIKYTDVKVADIKAMWTMQNEMGEEKEDIDSEIDDVKGDVDQQAQDPIIPYVNHFRASVTNISMNLAMLKHEDFGDSLGVKDIIFDNIAFGGKKVAPFFRIFTDIWSRVERIFIIGSCIIKGELVEVKVDPLVIYKLLVIWKEKRGTIPSVFIAFNNRKCPNMVSPLMEFQSSFRDEYQNDAPLPYKFTYKWSEISKYQIDEIAYDYLRDEEFDFFIIDRYAM